MLPEHQALRRWFVPGVLAASFAIRAAFGLFAVRGGTFLTVDGRDYFELACNVASGRGYVVEGARWFEPPRGGPAPDLSRPPLLPLVLAAFFVVLPDSQYVAAVVVAALGAGAALACATLAGALWGERCGRRTLVVAGLWPPFVFYSAFLLTECLMPLLVAALILLLIRTSAAAQGETKRQLWRAAASGFVLGLSALCRPTMLIGLALVPLWALWCPGGRLRRRATVAATILAVAAATISPWTIRNYVSSGEFIPVSNLGGYVFWLGNNESNLRAYASFDSHDFLEHQRRALGEETSRLVEELSGLEGRSPRSQDRFWTGRGLAFVRERPAGFVFLVFARLWHFLRPWVSPAAYSCAASVASFFLWVPLFAMAAVGMVRLWRADRAAAMAVLTVVACGAAVHALTHVMIRHRVPFLDVAAVVLSAPVGFRPRWKGIMK